MAEPAYTYGWDANGVPIQTIATLSGAGVPSNAVGTDGQFYFRTDGGLLATSIYHKVAGVWVGLAVV